MQRLMYSRPNLNYTLKIMIHSADKMMTEETPSRLVESLENFLCLRDKFLLWNLVSRNLKLKHRRSYLGFFWILADPALNALVYYFVFQIIARLAVPNYLLHLFAGLLPWTFFVQTITSGMESIVGNRALITKTPVNLNVFPLSITLTNLINFSFALPVLFLLPFFFGQQLGLLVGLLPVVAALLALFSYSLARLLAIVYTFFRDFRNILNIFVKLWFYATPILYQDSMIPENFKFLYYVNPLTSFILCFKGIFYSNSLNLDHLATAAIWTFSMMILSIYFSKLYFKRLVEYL